MTFFASSPDDKLIRELVKIPHPIAGDGGATIPQLEKWFKDNGIVRRWVRDQYNTKTKQYEYVYEVYSESDVTKIILRWL